MPLDVGKAHTLGLVKAVIAREGRVRDGNVMERDNIVAGAGALRAVAAAGIGLVDVDHFKHSLPPAYVQKYGSGINDPYPVGHVLDAQAVTGKDGLAEVQAIMMISNPTMYNLISAGRIKGCSVVDMARKKVCEADSCKFEGSAYVMNTIALEGTPNCAGTWAAPVTESDIGTIVQHRGSTAEHTVTPIARLLTERLEHCAEIPAIAAKIV